MNQKSHKQTVLGFQSAFTQVLGNNLQNMQEFITEMFNKSKRHLQQWTSLSLGD